MKVGLVFAVALLTAAVIVYVFEDHSQNRPPGPDTASVSRAEEKSLLRDVQIAYAAVPSLAEPLAVHISGKNATLNVANKMGSNQIYYAQVWHDVYSKYHGGSYVVCMHIVWKNGGFYQIAPLDDLGWFVPKCPIP
jgi:hypothetical protein